MPSFVDPPDPLETTTRTPYPRIGRPDVVRRLRLVQLVVLAGVVQLAGVLIFRFIQPNEHWQAAALWSLVCWLAVSWLATFVFGRRQYVALAYWGVMLVVFCAGISYAGFGSVVWGEMLVLWAVLLSPAVTAPLFPLVLWLSRMAELPGHNFRLRLEYSAERSRRQRE